MEKEIIEIKERLEKLEKAIFVGTTVNTAAIVDVSSLDYSLNERAFLKRYSSGFNGQEFFTLICAYLVGGKENTHLTLIEVKSVWKRCSGIIGIPYSSTFSTRAKERGWIDSSKGTRGSYVLSKYWGDIIKSHE